MTTALVITAVVGVLVGLFGLCANRFGAKNDRDEREIYRDFFDHDSAMKP
jgi:hypothetical protein